MNAILPEPFDDREELSLIDEAQAKKEKDRERIEAERKELQAKLVAGNIFSLRDRIAFVLNHSIEARNSDIELAWEFWRTFEPTILDGPQMTKQQMMRLTRISSISRERQKIQNEYGLFQADPDVKKQRGIKEETFKQSAIDDKPDGLGGYTVYIDETGKTQDFLSVGSLWILGPNKDGVRTPWALRDWKKSLGIDYEFHFTKMKKGSLPIYKEFFEKFIAMFPNVGFKLITIRNRGISDKNQAIVDLTYHLISKGISHENSTGRATLPRVLHVYIDEEEPGSDRLKIENIKERITRQKIEGLYFGRFDPLNSTGDFFVQAVDLFTGAVNRKLHFPDGTSEKDELAHHILKLVGLNLEEIDKENTEVDRSQVFNLIDGPLKAE